MSSIASLNNSPYYQLSDPSAGPGGSASANPQDALLQALAASNVQAAASSSNAYLLDLSPQAQQFLNGGGSSAAANPVTSASQNFTLSAQDQQAIANILEKYKDGPFTQTTFEQIQNDLQAAGLDPATLSRLDQAQSFNATALFIDDLNGNYSDATAMTNPNESQKSSNYMQQVIGEWQQMSGNTGNTPAPASASDSATATSAS